MNSVAADLPARWILATLEGHVRGVRDLPNPRITTDDRA
jgi:hypothetical protein